MIESAAQTTQRIRTRARRFYLASWFSLLLILVALVGGAFFFSIAGTLAFGDVKNAEKLKESQFAELRNREKLYEVEVTKAQVELLAELKGSNPSGAQGYGPVARQLQVRLKEMEEQLARVRDSLAKINTTTDAQARNDFVTPQFINASITRALVVVLIVFLVKILSGLNVYSLRLSAHYNAIADALDLSAFGVDGGKLNTLVGSLSVNTIDFPSKEEFSQNAFVEALRAVNAMRNPRP